MSLTPNQCAAQIVKASRPVVAINGFTTTQWYRAPKDGRHGPWAQGDVEFLDEKLWNSESCCLYFLINSKQELKYVGMSVNQLKDRWRMSPAFDKDGVALAKREMFHSQCWPKMCALENTGQKETYSIVVINDQELVSVLAGIDHEISALSNMKHESDIVVIAMERWIIKKCKNYLWNKR